MQHRPDCGETFDQTGLIESLKYPRLCPALALVLRWPFVLSSFVVRLPFQRPSCECLFTG
jgi:hypothetical protein